MTGKYYTTADIKNLFGWASTTTVQTKRDSGFLPAPDLKGRPNKWLKPKIDAILNAPNNPKQNDAK